jgi:hypothetical protein
MRGQQRLHRYISGRLGAGMRKRKSIFSHAEFDHYLNVLKLQFKTVENVIQTPVG